MKVFKFGGAGVHNVERIQNLATLLEVYKAEDLIIIISAMGKTTNALEKVAEAFYAGKKEDALQLFDVVKKQHVNTAKYLLVTRFNACLSQLMDFFTVVEDNDMNIMLLSLLLKKYFIEFDVAKDGEAGLELFNSKDYDIILTDINVPKLTGDQLAAAIRRSEDPVKAALPIIALTASIVADDLDSYLRTGIDDIMIKPFKEADFSAMLKKHLDHKIGASFA